MRGLSNCREGKWGLLCLCQQQVVVVLAVVAVVVVQSSDNYIEFFK